MSYTLDLTYREPRLNNVLNPKIFVLDHERVVSAADSFEPRFMRVILRTFDDAGRTKHQTNAKMYDVRRLTDGQYRAIGEHRVTVFSVVAQEINKIEEIQRSEGKRENHHSAARIDDGKLGESGEGWVASAGVADGNQEATAVVAGK